jgi:hypothetical protein
MLGGSSEAGNNRRGWQGVALGGDGGPWTEGASEGAGGSRREHVPSVLPSGGGSQRWRGTGAAAPSAGGDGARGGMGGRGGLEGGAALVIGGGWEGGAALVVGKMTAKEYKFSRFVY